MHVINNFIAIEKIFWFLILDLESKGAISLNDVDISIMYAILKESVERPKQGWGKPPEENNTSVSDDIERNHQCRNLICHTDASGIDTEQFNETVMYVLEVVLVT